MSLYSEWSNIAAYSFETGSLAVVWNYALLSLTVPSKCTTGSAEV